MLHGLAQHKLEAAPSDNTFLLTRLVDRWWKMLSCTLQKNNSLQITSRAATADRYWQERHVTEGAEDRELRIVELYVREWE